MRNVLLQIRFKCLDFAQKCCQNAGNAISETQISKMFPGGTCPRTPQVGRAYVYPAWGRHIQVFPRVVNPLATPVCTVHACSSDLFVVMDVLKRIYTIKQWFSTFFAPGPTWSILIETATHLPRATHLSPPPHR